MSLKCHSGTDKSSYSIECPSSDFDICAIFTIESVGQTTVQCLTSSDARTVGYTDPITDKLNCKKLNNQVAGEFCFCNSDDCNDPSKLTSQSGFNGHMI